MRSLIEIHNTKDLRHLLIEYKEDADQSELVPIYDKIMAEYEQLAGTDNYKRHFQESDVKIWDNYIINAITLTVQCIQYGREDLAQKLIDEFKLKINLNNKDKTIQQLENKAKSIINKHKIKQLNQKEHEEKPATWESLQVYIHQILGIEPDYDCSVAKYIEYDKSAKRKIELQKSK